MRGTRHIALFAATLLMLAGAAPAAQAQDFFSALFGGLIPQRRADPPPMVSLPYADDGAASRAPAAPPRSASSGGSQAYCVRSCDGRYFPLSVSGDGQSKAATCNSLCPASETKVFYGHNAIDNAVAQNGKRYSDLPNAFKYRNEIVAGCTCNGKDQFGLAQISIDDDPTVRKGDIVASEEGLMVAGRKDRRHGELNFSPASAAISARYERVPVVASE
jgi:hypothetical protein